MKQTTLVKILAAVCAVGLSTAFAQTSTTTTTTNPVTGTTTESTVTSAGTITTYSPDADYITFRTTTDAAPVRYYYTKETSVVDPSGRVVTWSAVRPDVPATVYYVREGDRMVVRKVVLSKPAVIEQKETTTTTTTEKKH
jgi:Alkylmercury lyase